MKRLVAAGLLTFLLLAACGPYGAYERTPGLFLGGSEAEPPADWSRVQLEMITQIETRSWFPLVHNIWAASSDGKLYADRGDEGDLPPRVCRVGRGATLEGGVRGSLRVEVQVKRGAADPGTTLGPASEPQSSRLPSMRSNSAPPSQEPIGITSSRDRRRNAVGWTGHSRTEAIRSR